MPKRTYLDSGVLIAAFQGKDDVGRRALEILDDPQRALIVSRPVCLEVFPKPAYERRAEETEFYRTLCDGAVVTCWSLPALEKSHDIAENYGLAALDAIHIAHALEAGADEFVTSERPGRPMFRVKEITIRSLHELDP